MAVAPFPAAATRRPITQEQREAVGHFLGTYRSTLSAVLLLAWMQLWIVRNIKIMSEEMATMGSLEVISTPFPVNIIRKFVILPIVVGLGWHVYAYGVGKASTITLIYAQLFSLSYALFGAAGPEYTLKHYPESLPTAAYTAVLLLLTCNIFEVSLSSQLPFQLLASGSNAISFARLYGMVAGCTLFGLFAAADMGDQTKRWPVPVLLGVTYGYVAGSLGGVWLRHYQQKKFRASTAATAKKGRKKD